jgi:hypothetical protein
VATLFSDLYLQMDSLLISLYRITGYPHVDYFLGTFLLAFICAVLGEMTLTYAMRINKKYIDELNEETDRKEQLSIEAYRSGDKTSYKALNKEATDVWSRKFFTMAAYSAGMLWPLPFALGWMQTRFQSIEFPVMFPLNLLFGKTVGYLFTFIPLYILARILSNKLKKLASTSSLD